MENSGIHATFNTGRQYGKIGQRISARVCDGRIAFVDIDRHISGTIPLASGKTFSSARELREFTMHSYDENNYNSLTDATLEHALCGYANQLPDTITR